MAKAGKPTTPARRKHRNQNERVEMKGFDPKFRDFPDYIVRITEEIWEGRGLHTLHDYYEPDVIMRMPLGIMRGNQDVIDGTLATIAEFPDRQLLGEDVIWSGNEDKDIFPPIE